VTGQRRGSGLSTPLSTKIRFGATIADVHGKPRGYRIFVGSTDLTNAGTLTPQIADIDGPKTVTAGQMLVDLDRGRFAVPAGAIPTGTPVTVEYSAEDTAADARVFDSLAQRLPHLVPAGIVPVVIDTRKSTVDPTNFELTARATKP